MAWIELCKTDALAIGSSRLCEVGNKKVALFRTASGFFALDDHCPHRSGPLSQGAVAEETVTCPWHQWKFRLQDGVCVGIPSEKVETFAVLLRDGAVGIEVA